MVFLSDDINLIFAGILAIIMALGITYFIMRLYLDIKITRQRRLYYKQLEEWQRKAEAERMFLQ